MDTVTRYKEAPLRGLIGWEMRHLKITNGVVAGNQIPLFAQRTRDSHVRGQTGCLNNCEICHKIYR